MTSEYLLNVAAEWGSAQALFAFFFIEQREC